MDTLPPGEAHVWYVRLDGLDPDLLSAWEAWMSPDERDRYARFKVADPRLQYVATRALVRTTLSRYAPVAPCDWSFTPGPHGRPEITGPEGAPRLRFNLSNTRGLVACVVASAHDVGIDVEDRRRARSLGVADRFFAPSEVAALRRLPEADQHERFLVYWTLKESYIKARGMGLALPLSAFAFDLGRAGIRIGFDARIADDPAAWWFGRLEPTPDHVLAVAVRKGSDPDPTLVIRDVVPPPP